MFVLVSIKERHAIAYFSASDEIELFGLDNFDDASHLLCSIAVNQSLTYIILAGPNRVFVAELPDDLRFSASLNYERY